MSFGDNIIPFPGQQSPDDDCVPQTADDPTTANSGPPDYDLIRQWANDLMAATGSPTEALAALRGLSNGPHGLDGFFTRERPVLLARRPDRAAFIVRVDLDGAEPPIWRRLRLASDLKLSQLHDILQVAMGWTDSHLHHFVMGPKVKDRMAEPFLTHYDEAEGLQGTAEWTVRLDETIAEKGDRLFYEYDFGDGWWHTIKLEAVEPSRDGDPRAACLAGRRACPPEDVGGIWGYRDLLAALAGNIDPENAEWLNEQLAWLPDDFNPAEFDVDLTNEDLRDLEAGQHALDTLHPAVSELLTRSSASPGSPLDVLARAAASAHEELTEDDLNVTTARYRRMLTAVGGGLKLTAAGYLPPRLVSELYHDLSLDDEWWGKGNREDQTLPVLTLRESATKLGLLRKDRGHLMVTKVGERLANDPAALLSHIASRLPLGRPYEKDAGVVFLLLAAAGQNPLECRDMAASLMSDVGWLMDARDPGWTTYHVAQPTLDVFTHLTGNKPDAELRARVARRLLRRPDSSSRAPATSHRR